MPLPEGHKSNFNTILRAARMGDLVLVRATWKITGEPVTVICIGDSSGSTFAPFAMLFESGDPSGFLMPPETADALHYYEEGGEI